MQLFYNHRERKIVDDKGNFYTYEQASELMSSGKVKDHNIALETLQSHNGDMEAVEQYYQSC